MTDIPDLPAAVRERAAALLTGSLDVVPLQDAATVVLLRDGPEGLEVYMQRRTRTLVFAAGVYVFPGGRVEEQDVDPAVPFTESPPQPVPFAVGGDIVRGIPGPSDPEQVYRGLVVAAVRETLEEAGVLLAVGDHGPVAQQEAHLVRELLLGGVPLAEALGTVGARLAYRGFVAYAHWMTPAVEVRRFDTRFFAAVLPPGQHARSASGESEDSGWVRPAVMLQRMAAGEVVMLPPTIAALQALRTERDAASVVAAGHRPGLRPVLPHPFREGAGISWRLVDGYTGRDLETP
jgi:8-oxo-dGTP pyrophosphatase MutT (NUDIX family)